MTPARRANSGPRRWTDRRLRWRRGVIRSGAAPGLAVAPHGRHHRRARRRLRGRARPRLRRRGRPVRHRGRAHPRGREQRPAPHGGPGAAILGVIVVAYSTLGALTTGYPLAAALAMAFVAFTTSVMTAAPPVGLLVGLVSSYAYFLVTGVGVIESRAVGGTLPQIGLLGLVGLLTGLGARRPARRDRAAPRHCPRAPARAGAVAPGARWSRPSAPSTPMPRTACAGPSPSAWRCSGSRRWARTTRSGSCSRCS